MKDSAMLGDLQYPPWQLRFGANVYDGSVEFRVWASKVTSLEVRILGDRPRTIPMTRGVDSEFSVIEPDVAEGTD